MKITMRGRIGILTLALSALLLVGCGGAKSATPTASPAQEIPEVKSDGRVIADAKVLPAKNADLSMSVSGIVAEVLVEEGQTVEAHAPLLRLQNARQQAGLAEAQARLAGAQAKLAELKAGARSQEMASSQAALDAAAASLSKLKEGARPEEIAVADAALASAEASLAKVEEGADELQLVAARAEVANAEAAVQQAQAAYDPVSARSDVGMLPQSLQLQQATNSLAAARARYESLAKGPTKASLAQARAGVKQAQAELARVKATARPSDIAAAEAEVRRAQAQLDLLEAGARPEQLAAAEAEVAAAQAAVQQAQVALDETELRAPFAGVVAAIRVKAGEPVSPGVTVAQFADLSSWRIETDDLTEIEVVRVQEGDPVTVTFDAISDLELSGNILRIKPIGENKQGDITYTVIVQLDTMDERLRWNMTATVAVGAAE